MNLSRARILSSHPLQALLELDKASRDGEPVVVMAADPRLDPQLRDSLDDAADPEDPATLDEAAFALVEERRGETRLIGPASAGIASGAGPVLLVCTLGERFRPLVERLGAELGLAIDIGLGWDLSPAEIVALALAGSPQLTRVALVLPVAPPRGPEEPLPAAWRGLAQAIAAVADDTRHTSAIAVCLDPRARAALATHGVELVSDLDELVARLCPGSAPSPEGSSAPAERELPSATAAAPARVALISALDGATRLFEDLARSLGLTLAEPRPETLDALRGELPRMSRLGAHVGVPRPTRRHLELASRLLSADPGVDAVWLTPNPEEDPFRAARALASTPAPSPIPARPARGPCVETPDEDPRTHAHLMALRLMRRGADEDLLLGRDEVASLLGPWLPSTPALAVSSLAAANDSAARLGFPVALLLGGPDVGIGLAPLADKRALTAAWESLMASLEAEAAPTSRHGADPWRTRLVVAHRGDTTRVEYRSTPLPTWRHADEWLPIPARLTDLGTSATHATPLDPLARALGALAAHHPELVELSVLLDAEGRLIDARGRLAPLAART